MSESAIFNAAVKLPLEQREAFLDQACGADAGLRREVESLLKAHDASGGILCHDPARHTADHRPIAEGPGTVIGPYKLMEQIGEGGFGLVFVAEQQSPVRRKVALKIIKPGMDTRDVIARFEAERQALALMDHPNIARVFDGGTTDSGRPYFVMELVKGVAITDYCDQQQLTARARLELFQSVCQAVQHAHSKGVIHRDLKPSNILVAPHDGVPVVKVIDFGVAKAIGQQLTDKTIYTRFAQMVGTPLYMSPEQAEINALDVDIRSDVYSLGVLLYELLTGTTPFDRGRFQKAAFDEIRRIIKEEEPPRPSTRLSTMGEPLSKVSSQRKTEPGALSAFVRGDLDWIVMKCLEKERSRRYETAVGLAKDVGRYLANEPVEACPPSAWYRLRKFVSRNRSGVIVAAAMLTLLCMGLCGTIAGLIQARIAADRAAAAEAAAVRDRDDKEKARQAEAKERAAAQKERDDARAAREELRKTLYFSNLKLIQTAWEANNPTRINDLLDATRPGRGERDLRGWEWYYWDRQLNSDLRRMKFDFSPAIRRSVLEVARGEFVAFSANGERLATFVPREENPRTLYTVKVWDTAAGREVWSFPLEESRLLRIALSGDGRRLALAMTPGSQGGEGKIVVWDVALKKKLASFKTLSRERLTHTTMIVPADNNRPMLDHNGRFLAAYLRGRVDDPTPPALYIWDLDAGPNAEPVKHVGVARGVTLSPDGSRFTTLSFARQKNFTDPLRYELKIHDAASGKVIHTCEWPTQPGLESAVGPNSLNDTRLAFSPDGTKVAAVQYDLGGVVWDAQGKLLTTFRPSQRVSYVAFSPDGKSLTTWTGEANAVGTLWDATTGVAVRTWKGHVRPLVGAAFVQGGTRVLSVDSLGDARVWDAAFTTRPGPRVRRVGGFANWSGDGSRQCVIAVDSSVVSVRDAAGRETLSFTGHKSIMRSVQLSHDGRFAVSVDQEGTAKGWDTHTGKVLAEQRWPADTPEGRVPPFPQVSERGARFLLNTPEGGVRVWDLADGGREVFARPDLSLAVGVAPVLSPDGGRLAILGAREKGMGAWCTLTVWVIDTPGKRLEMKGRIVGARFSPDGRRIAARLTPDGGKFSFTMPRTPVDVKVWDADTGKELAYLKGEVDNGPLAFSPDGKSLATPARDGSGDVLIWDVATAKIRLRLKGHTTGVDVLAFSPDGKRLASAAQAINPSRGDIRLWDAASGAELLALSTADLGGVNRLLYFSPDGHRLYTASMSVGGVRVESWDATPRGEGKER